MSDIVRRLRDIAGSRVARSIEERTAAEGADVINLLRKALRKISARGTDLIVEKIAEEALRYGR